VEKPVSAMGSHAVEPIQRDCGRLGFLPAYDCQRSRQCHSSSSRFQSDTASFLIQKPEFSWALLDGCCLMHARIFLDIGYRTSCAKVSGTAQELSTYNHLSMQLVLFVPFFATCIWSDHLKNKDTLIRIYIIL
jgi:hypothetical protein